MSEFWREVFTLPRPNGVAGYFLVYFLSAIIALGLLLLDSMLFINGQWILGIPCLITSGLFFRIAYVSFDRGTSL